MSDSLRSHEIRLRRPWNRTSNRDLQSVVVHVPDSLDQTDASTVAGDQVRYQRGFNAPTGLTEAETIELCIDAWQGRLVSVQVNGCLFSATDAPLVIDLSNVIEGFNRIEVTIMSESGELPRIHGEVVLRIQEE